MQSEFNKNRDQTIAFGSLSSTWLSTKQLQLSLSKCVATDLETAAKHRYHVKQKPDSMYHEYESSSTLSSGQSHHNEATFAQTNVNTQNISFQPGLFETQLKKGEAGTISYPPWGKDVGVEQQIQTQHNHPLACASNIFAAESPFGSILTAYGPNAVVYPNIKGVAPSRLILPLDYTEGLPVYVNAKQYHAILRRRKIRAKLEVHKKIATSRKPYLHESRHRHALKRVRGSGGRFLNTKNTQQAKPPAPMCGDDLSLKHIGSNASELDNQHSESNSWETSTHSGSEVSCIFNNDDVFQQHDFRSSVNAFPTLLNGTGLHGLAPGNGILLSGGRGLRIGTTM